MRNLLLVLLSIAVTACGTTSALKQGEEKVLNKDFSNYNSVVVSDFGDATKNQNMPEYAGANFADRIISAIREKGTFEKVTDNPQEISGNTLVVSGDVTRYQEGNSTLKFLIGFGAGGTYFDANVSISDMNTQSQLGVISVDKNSWALGGAIAAGQSVDHFMNQAAKKIADELSERKTNSTGAKNQPVKALSDRAPSLSFN